MDDTGANQEGTTRRQLLLTSAAGVAALGLGLGRSQAATATRTRAGGVPPRDPLLVLGKFVDRLPIPPVVRPQRRGSTWELTIRMRTVRRKLHSELPASTLWTYEGAFPGPTVEVERGQRVRATWVNQLEGTMPIIAVRAAEDAIGRPGEPPTNWPGREKTEPVTGVEQIPPWAAVHLHGAHVGAGNDGWGENVILPGDAQLSEYPNTQAGTTLWYHDHAMHLTRWTQMAGLAGMYVIRDKEEAALGLPRGKYEIPLILCDRNFDLDANKKPTGQLLHKVEIASPMKIIVPFAGPYTLVNGVIWPYADVEARWYRFRLLNMSNSRVYRLVVLDEQNQVVPGALKLIGTDQGLLGAPAPLTGPLVLSPAERVDVLVDFRELAGKTLKLVDTRPGITPGQPDLSNNINEPDVMQFRVAGKTGGDRFALPATLSPTFKRFTLADLPPGHAIRWIVLTRPGAPAEAEQWEMTEVDPATVTIPGDGIVQVQGPDGQIKTLKRISKNFNDTANFLIERGQWEEWRFLDLGGPPHPMHLHAVDFHPVARDIYDVSGWSRAARGTTKPIKYLRPGVLEPHELGRKDVIRAAGGEGFTGELITIAVRFDAVGRFVYHCHTLEHEVHMMRPFVVMPTEMMTFGGHPAGHGGH
ncbi:multicopper oxidase family protein [Nonomuraea typhae]|uniref:multicopper oxidase family protein n=1 Tax=Nonomuraea typhae TaxID=2603600 RepID=UPI0012FC5DD1|nr:multicopper oxidase domain-containing protein [Nonomuraea typhae]